MISWGIILYGAGLSVIAAVALAVVGRRERSRVALAFVALAAFAGPIGWNAVLHARESHEFFVDAPVAIFPVSWQDVGSGVWTLALGSILHGLTQEKARNALSLALIAGVAAFLVDIYLY